MTNNTPHQPTEAQMREQFEWMMKQEKVPQKEWWAHAVDFHKRVWQPFLDSPYSDFKDWYREPHLRDLVLFPSTNIKDDVVMKEICKKCGNQQISSHNSLINRMRRIIATKQAALASLPRMEHFDSMALTVLRNNQLQLDADGIMVGVSRQALDMAIAWIDQIENKNG